MARYSLPSIVTTNTTTKKTMGAITAATGATTLRRAWIYDIVFGTSTTPGDTAITYAVDRQTTLGTGTTTAATPIDSETTVASLMTNRTDYSIEPTVTVPGDLLSLGINQRASYRWVAAPGGELVVPAVNVAGIGLRSAGPAGGGSFAGTTVGSIHYWE